MSNKYTVGIDFGTTRSAISYVAANNPEIITVDDGERVMPSVVQFRDAGEVNVGRSAANTAIEMPERTITEVKRRMGTEEPIPVAGEEYLPEQIASLVIAALVSDAQERIGVDVEITNTVITVPAYFGDKERTATESAAEIAGLTVDRLLPEPSAACLAYGLHENKLSEAEHELVFVYDLGGGTFDATLVDIDYEINSVETLNTAGNNKLGGMDWTDEIVDWIAEGIEADTGVTIRENAEQLSRVREKARETKHRLSNTQSVEVSVPFVVPEESYTFSAQLTRDEFETRTADLIQATQESMDELFERSDNDPQDVDKVLLVGGASRMTQVEALVTGYFGQEPSKEINPDEAVALGAAVQAEIIDERGASAAEMLPGESDSIVLIDVVPQSLGVRLSDGTVDHIIETDEQIPTQKRKEEYSTAEPDQTTVAIEVYQGEEQLADENTKIGEAVLRDIPPREPSEPTLAVEFRINTNGRLEVEGEDLKTGKKVETTIESGLRHSDAEIEELSRQLPSTSD